MSSISGSVVNATFTYDANGNQTGGNGLTLTYASFNKPATIARGSALIAFAHDSEHQRYKQMNPTGETLYLAGSGVMAERSLGAGGVVQWTNYLSAGGEMVAMRVDRSDATTYTRYFHKDHLGSIATITDAAGAVVERLSYDAWGKRRFPNGQDDPSGSIASQTTRGFTGHEQLSDVGLIHMNGRVYDPMLGRFGTPDPMTEDPYNSQGWNRYTYVGNSPLNATDPSGYCWKGCFWQKPFKALGGLLRKFPIIGQIIQVAASAICIASVVCAPFARAVAGLASAITTGLASGNLGMALKAGFIATATAFAMTGVGDITAGLPGVNGDGSLQFLKDAHIFNIAAHAAVGCGSSVASGGKCGSGALAAAVGSFATPLTNGLGFGERLTVMTTAGGLASIAGGGKFGNGAVTAAFGYLFNEVLHFDGSKATLMDDDGQVLGEYPATSGREGVTDPKASWKGPLPEGDYTLFPTEISEVRGFWYWARNLLRGDWGTYRTPLHPNEGTNTYGRNGFFLHGGRYPGSAGCIDVGKCDIDLFSYLKGLTKPVNVHVRYPKPTSKSPGEN